MKISETRRLHEGSDRIVTLSEGMGSKDIGSEENSESEPSDPEPRLLHFDAIQNPIAADSSATHPFGFNAFRTNFFSPNQFKPYTSSAEPVVIQASTAHPYSETWQAAPLTHHDASPELGTMAGTVGMLLACLGAWLRSPNMRPRWRNNSERKKRALQSLDSKTRLEAAALAAAHAARSQTGAKTDSLTGLTNRHWLIAIGETLLSQHRLSQHRLSQHSDQQDISAETVGTCSDTLAPALALLWLNVERFRDVNSKWGYEAGDDLLRQLSERLRLTLDHQHTDSAVIARMGGDEFALLLVDASEESIHQLNERILTALNKPFFLQHPSAASPIAVSYRAGTARAELSELARFDQLMAKADAAMNEGGDKSAAIALSTLVHQPAAQSSEALKGHLHRLVALKPACKSFERSHSGFEGMLSQAITQNQLQIHYQPIVDLSESGQNKANHIDFKTVGFEALIRWNHPELGLLQPAQFLPTAQKNGLSVAVDRWVMETVCQQLSMWQQAQPIVNVNLFANHLMRSDLTDYIQRLLSIYPIAPHQLNLEITEGELIADLDKAADTLHRIRALGLSVSLDDFGSGYSSLSYLDRLPADVVKIDQSFIHRIGGTDNSTNADGTNVDSSAYTPQSARIIIESVLELAEKLNVRVVAEGIERRDQLELLRAMHCGYGQGYLFSRPVNAQSASALLQV